MKDVWAHLLASIPSLWEILSTFTRLVVAAGIGALIGRDRERHQKPAGLRTHMLVAIGAALFVLPFDRDESYEAMARAVQGIAAGIGFIGAGCILKEGGRVRGLTTAGSVWITAAMGAGAGVGRIWIVLLAAVLAWFVLSQVERFERELKHD